mmetsp:Transcript_4340/g.10505  ORF Transcript_4340/g.10505 Transcript_4340/m.10505 type:complete len:402 (-) Transcript_4340:95-1300(-)
MSPFCSGFRFFPLLVLWAGIEGVPLKENLAHRRDIDRSTRRDGGLQGFDRDVAEMYLNFSRIAYCEDDLITDWSCKICQDMQGFQTYFVNAEKLVSRHVGVFVGYYEQSNTAVVSFRGTDYLINWVQDLEYYKVDSRFPACDSSNTGTQKHHHCRVHSGFFQDWQSVKASVFNATRAVLRDHPDAAVYITGHSLGAALAALCALELSMLFNRTDIGLYSFGEPRVGNKYFADFFAERVPNTSRIVHQDDVVPHLPPQGKGVLLLTDFHHHPTEVWQTGSKDDDFVICDQTGEDPKCSNSLPQVHLLPQFPQPSSFASFRHCKLPFLLKIVSPPPTSASPSCYIPSFSAAKLMVARSGIAASRRTCGISDFLSIAMESDRWQGNVPSRLHDIRQIFSSCPCS